MHIIEFKVNYEPEVCAGIMLDSNTAEDICQAGHSINLYVPKPTRGITKNVISSTPRVETKIDGRLTIYRYRMFKDGKSLIFRTFRYLLCCIKQLWFGFRDKHCELIFAGSTPPFQGLVVCLLKKIKRIPFVYNCQDIFPESMLTAGVCGKSSIVWSIGNWIAEVAYNAADKIIVISETMRDTLISKGVPETKIEIVYNWVDENVIHPVTKEKNTLIEELNIPRYRFTVVYAGNLGYAQAVDILLEAAERLKEETNIGFLVFGNGVNEDELLTLAKKKCLTNVHFYPLQPYARVSEVYSLGDACIVSCKKGTGGNAMPSKTWSIMGCGRAVLASFDKGTLLEEIVKEKSCGLFSEAGDVDQLVKNILYLNEHIEDTMRYGNNARNYIEKNLNREKCTGQIIRIIQEVYASYRDADIVKGKNK